MDKLESGQKVKWVQPMTCVPHPEGKTDRHGEVLPVFRDKEFTVKNIEEWEKEEKQNLMHVAVCRLFMEDGYYKFVGKDQDGWPHYELLKAIPHIHLKDQEGLLKEKIVGYFKEMKYID